MSTSYWCSIVWELQPIAQLVMSLSYWCIIVWELWPIAQSNEPELLAFSSSELRVSSDLNWFDFLSWPKTKGHFLMQTL